MRSNVELKDSTDNENILDNTEENLPEKSIVQGNFRTYGNPTHSKNKE